MSNFDLHIIPECYVDTKLVNTIVSHNRKTHNHQKNCDKVAATMQKEFKDDFAVGIVDKDKKILPYSKEFEIISQAKGLELLKHKTKPHYLIFILPAMEKWIIDNLSEIGHSLADFGLPNDFEQFKKITKTSKSEDEDTYSKNLSQLFTTLKQKKAKNVLILSYWIEYLKENAYQADSAYISVGTQKILESD